MIYFAKNKFDRFKRKEKMLKKNLSYFLIPLNYLHKKDSFT